MRTNRTYLLVLTLLFTLVVCGIALQKKKSTAPHIATADKHRGVCWVAGPYPIDSASIAELVQNNVNWISQTPFGWQREHNSPDIGTQIGSQTGWWGERDEGLRQTTRLAREQGIKTILKPHIWLRDSQGKWRGEISMQSEEDWQKWFANYEQFILHYAQLAQEEGIEMLCIGTELHRTCVERENDWRQLIEKIRNVYTGELTYAANFADEYQDVAFWDLLDYIGVQGYFPVAQNENPTIQEVEEGWQKHLSQLKAVSAKYQKPILFTEIGYKSTKDAGIEPWQWPQRMPFENREAIHSEEAQANLYTGMFRALMDQPFIAGFHLWKWYPKVSQLEERSRSRRNPDDSRFNIDFTPQHKKAQQVMKHFYGQMNQ